MLASDGVRPVSENVTIKSVACLGFVSDFSDFSLRNVNESIRVSTFPIARRAQRDAHDDDWALLVCWSLTSKNRKVCFERSAFSTASFRADAVITTAIVL